MSRFAFAKVAALLIAAALVTACGSRTASGIQPLPVSALDNQLAVPAASLKLMALYSFNGTLADSSGNGKTATDTASPTYVTGAPFGGKAIAFNGSGHAIVHAPLNISVAAVKQITFGGWMKALSISTPQYGVVSNDNGDFDRTIDIDTRPNGTPSWSAFVGGTVVGKVHVAIGKWYFVAVSFDQSIAPGHYVLYVNNGTATTTVSGTDHFDADSVTSSVSIGRNPGFDHPFNGDVANAFFYHGILTAAQIATIVAKGPSAIPR